MSHDTDCKILVLDDDTTFLLLMKRILESRNYTPLCVATYGEFQSLLKSETPDLIMLDVNLPEKNGFDIFVELMAVHDIPVLFVTGYPASVQKTPPHAAKLWEEKGREGLVDILHKPFDIHVLYEKLETMLNPS